MPITIKSNQVNIKNGNSYTTVDVISDGLTTDRVQAINNAIDNKKNAALASIPEVSELEDMIAEVFDSTKNYSAGNYVIYNDSAIDQNEGTNSLYKFVTDHAAGAWNSAQVIRVTAGGELADLKSTIGIFFTNEVAQFGESDVTTGFDGSISGGGVSQVRFAKLSSLASGRKIEKILYKSPFTNSTMTRFWIGKLVGNNITLIKTFVFYTISTKSVYVNGVDFELDTEIGENYLIGFNVASSSISGGYYGGSSGSYEIDGTVEEGGTFAYETRTYGVAIGATYQTIVSETRYDLDDLMERVDHIEKPIPLGEQDVSGFNGSIAGGGVAQVRLSKMKAPTKGGKINSIIYKSPFTSLTLTRFWIGKLDGGTITLLKTFVFSTISTKSTYVNGVDFELDVEVDKDCLIGFNVASSSPSGGYYGGSSGSYEIVGTVEEGGTYTFNERSYGVAIGAIYQGVVDGLRDDIDDLDSRVESIEEQLPNLIGSGIVRYGAKIPSNASIFIDSDIVHARVTYTNSSDSEVKISRALSGTAYDVCRTDFVNFGTGKIGFYKAHAYSATLQVYAEYSPGFSFVVGHSYDIFSIRYLGSIYQLTITDCWTQETYTATVVDGSNAIGDGWGTRTVSSGSGATVVFYENYSLQPENNRIAFIGDSYIEGSSIYATKEKRYASLAFSKLQGNAFLWGQGGASSSSGVAWLSTVMALSDSDYYMIPFGINDTDYTTWKNNMDSMIATIVAAGKTPVLATIPPASGVSTNEVHMQMNQYIRTLNYKYIDVAKLLSLNHDGITPDDSTMLSDHIHPTVASHELIFKLLVSTLPELFGTAIE